MEAGWGRHAQPFFSPVIRSSPEMLKVFRLPWAGLVSGKVQGLPHRGLACPGLWEGQDAFEA